MTAEPMCHEIALSNHMKVTLEYDPDGSRTAILWNEANEPIADGEAPVLAAAPAVQPSGRATIEFLEKRVSDETMRHLLSAKDVGSGRARLASILAALAHPPAQGSESGPTCQKCGGEIHGWCCQSCDAEFRENDAGNLVFDDEAALSPQPGPASEGDGE